MESLLALYNSYTYPYLMYCMNVWGCAAHSNLYSFKNKDYNSNNTRYKDPLIVHAETNKNTANYLEFYFN